MSEHDINEQEDTFDDNGSLLQEAMASGEAIQICRKSPRSKPNNKRMSLMNFFGVEEEPDEEEVVTAEPASLQNMRRIARAKREKQRQELESGVTGTPAAKRRPRRGVRRSQTLDNSHTMRRKSSFDVSPQRVRTMSPTRMSVALNKPSDPRPLVRSKTAPKPLGRSNTAAVAATPAFPFPNSWTTDEGSATGSSSPTSDAATRAKAHEETIKRLTVQDDDIQTILQDPQQFAKLQKVLRKHGAVTDGVLRQVLPLYVQHQLAAKKEEESKRKAEEEKTCMDRTAANAAVVISPNREE